MLCEAAAAAGGRRGRGAAGRGRAAGPPAAQPRRRDGGHPRGDRGVLSHCRFKNRCTEYVSEYGMKWMGGGAERQCGRAGPRLGFGRIVVSVIVSSGPEGLLASSVNAPVNID